MPDQDLTAPGQGPQFPGADRGQAIFDALAEGLKQRGNCFHAAGKHAKAVDCYTRGLGLACGADLRIALLLNRSLNHRKSGTLVAAQNDARAALSLPDPPLKAKYRLIESLIGSGLLKQADAEMAGSQDNSLKALRAQIARLRKQVRFDVYPSHLTPQMPPPLFADLKKRFEGMQQSCIHNTLLTRNPAAGLAAIAVACRSCPLLLLMGRFLVDDSPVFPGYLQHCARLLQEPLSDENNREAARFLQRIINNTWQSAAKDDEQDLPTLRWWLVYAQMECEFWKAARASLDSVLLDCTSGHFDAHYLLEALYMGAVIEFALSRPSKCGDFLANYFDLGADDVLDRNLADAKLLQLWTKYVHLVGSDHVDHKVLSQYVEDLAGIRDILQTAWDSNTYSRHSWIATKVYEALRLKIESPYQKVAELLSVMWENAEPHLLSSKPRHVDKVIHRMPTSGMLHGIVVRKRMTDPEKDAQRGGRWQQ